jgi:hypothetical protein
MEERFLVYENWTQRPKKAKVHKSSCGHARKGLASINENRLVHSTTKNGRWHGYFTSLILATSHAESLPDRTMSYCGFCLKYEK